MADERSMPYADLIGLLENELAVVEQAFSGLSAADWALPTLLEPAKDGQARWTLFELAGHLDISIGITRMVLDDLRPDPPECDAASFFIFPSTDVAVEFYDYAFTMVDGKLPAEMPRTLSSTFAASLRDARATPADAVGAFPGFDPPRLIRVDDWISSRLVEAVVHGIDLTDALGRAPAATVDGISHTAGLLDDLVARRAEPGRPADLDDDLVWVRAATGRDQHHDPRLPLIN